MSECSLKDIREKGIECYGSTGRLLASLLVAALYGIGGALILGIVSALDGKFDDFTQTRRIYFALLSVAAGFAGLQLLMLFRRRLLKEVEDAVEAETLKAHKKIEEETARQVQRESKIRDVIDSLTDALDNLPEEKDSKDDPEYRSLAFAAKREATQILLEVPTHRRVVILLGRLEREISGYPEAISILTKAIVAWKRSKQPFEANYAALLFNRACYKNRLAEEFSKVSNSVQAEEKRGEAWTDLSEACELDENNKEEAKDDPDLATLYNSSSRKWEKSK